MAINYESYRKITSYGLVDGAIQTSDFANLTIESAKIGLEEIIGNDIQDNVLTNANLGDDSITQTKFAVDAVDVGSTKVSNLLGIANGGLNTNIVGANNSVGTYVSSTPSGNQGGLFSVSVYTGNSTWSRPSGCTRIRVQVQGGGGGGSGHGEAGAAGGYAEELINVESISSVSITVGGNGGGNTYHSYGGNGGTTSFGPYLSASGGEGARRVGGHSGGRPGAGSGGNLNIYGGGGAGHTYHGGGLGGQSYFGGANIGVHNSGPQPSDQEGRIAYGAGGSGAPRGIRRGASGRAGIVIVWHYR